MRSVRLFSVLCALAAISGAPVKAALLDGQTFFVRLEIQNTFMGLTFAQNSGFFDVGPHVELENFGANVSFPAVPLIMDIDFSDTQILVTLLNDQTLAFRQHLMFQLAGAAAPRITGLSVNPSTTWEGFNSSRANLGFQTFTLNLTTLTASPGQYILLDLVPEPAAAALLWPALGLVAARRRRRRASSRKASPAPLGDPS